MDSRDYTQLSATTGINFDNLRQKYQTMTREEKLDREREIDIIKKEIEEEEEKKRKRKEENEIAMKKLDDYKICQTCQGQGIVREIYNHYVMEKTCPECEGDSVIYRDLKTLLEP